MYGSVCTELYRCNVTSSSSWRCTGAVTGLTKPHKQNQNDRISVQSMA